MADEQGAQGAAAALRDGAGGAGGADAGEAPPNLILTPPAPTQESISVPADDDATGWADVHSKLGRPDRPEGYELDSVDTPGDGFDLTGEFRGWAHELGLSQKQAAGLVERFNARVDGIFEEQDTNTGIKVEGDLAGLRQDWGASYQGRIDAGRMAVRELGLDSAAIEQLEQGIGTRGTLELMGKVGVLLDRAGRGGGGDSDGSQGSPGAAVPRSAAAAADEIESLRHDPDFIRRVSTGDKVAQRRWTELHHRAYPDPDHD